MRHIWLKCIKATAVAMVVWTATACHDMEEQHHLAYAYQSVPLNGWDASQSVTFQSDTARKAGQYAIDVALRTTDAYPYQSLSLLVETRLVKRSATTTDSVMRDTLRCRITNANGEPIGTGLTNRQQQFRLRTIGLNRGDSISLRIAHIMKQRNICGVTDVGIEITKEFSLRTYHGNRKN